jgi:hypothetical protein
MIGKTALAEYAKLTAERETLNQRQLAAGTAGAAAPQGAGYRTVTSRAAVLKSVVSKPPFGVHFRLERVNRQPPIQRFFYMPFPLAAGGL